MIVKQADGRFTIFGIGKGEGIYNITLFELKGLELDLENATLNEDKNYEKHLMRVVNNFSDNLTGGVIKKLKKGQLK